MKVNLTAEQRKKIHDLWFIYGNRGIKANHNQHRFIQMILEENIFDYEKKTLYFSKKAKKAAKMIDPERKFNSYCISDECFNLIAEIILV